MKKFLKLILPPILILLFKKIKPSRYGWKGKYKSWLEANEHCTGYSDETIIKKVRESMISVKTGLAVFERDSVLFKESKYNWPLLTALLFSHSKKNYLSIIDFGGSLGSSYYQNKKYLIHLKNLKWGIVEQPSFVKVGKEEFENNSLMFFNDIEECNNQINPNTLLLSSVLQYLEDPYKHLEYLLSHNYQTIIIDRTPFVLGHEYVSIQYVPPKIYKANYPCWFFNENKLLNLFSRKEYHIIDTFETIDGKTSNYEFKGFIFEKST